MENGYQPGSVYIHYISWLAIYVGIEVIAFVSTANLLVRGARQQGLEMLWDLDTAI